MPNNDLQEQYIADTFQNLMQKPDLNKEEYFNGKGQPITVINRDAIGTVKMYYSSNYTAGAAAIGDFDGNGLGKIGTDWEGWALCDGRNGTPDLRGRFPVGRTDANPNTPPGQTSGITSNQKFFYLNNRGAGGGTQTGDEPDAIPRILIANLPPHRHTGIVTAVEDNSELVSILNNLVPGVSNITRISRLDNGTRWGLSGNNAGDAGGGYNTGDGTNNYSNQNELKSTPDNFYPPYTVVQFVMRVS
jgi:hypothetical protein